MKTKIMVFLTAICVCLCLGSNALASYKGTWKGKVVVYGTTCKSLYKNGYTENFSLKIKEIKKNGNLKAVKIAKDLPDYAKKLTGKINGHKIRFHYAMWGRYKTYDLTGTVKGKKMTLRGFNNTSGCSGGWHLKFDLKKK